MRSSVLCLCGALLILLGLVPAGEARTLVLKEGAYFREGPAKTSALLAELPTGTTLEVVGEVDGWLQVTLADGRGGYIWGEHTKDPTATTLALEPRTTPVTTADSPRPAAPAADAPRTSAPAASRDPVGIPTAVQDALATLRSDLAALRERAEPARAADLEALRAEVARLAEGQRQIAQRLDAPAAGLPGEPPASAAALGWLGIGLGLLIGWFTALLVVRRRDRRTSNRLRL